MAVLIDTSVFVAIERGGAERLTLDDIRDEDAMVSAVTASELLHGVHRAESAIRRGRREAYVEKVLGSMPILPFDLAVARVHARLWADLSRRGETIGAHDLQIAATALLHRLPLLTHNLRDFRRVPDLRVLTPS